MSTPVDYSTLFRVDGLIAVITGGGSGIGLYIAKALAANGAKAVYILGRREASLQSAAAQAANGNIIPIVTDVTSQESLEAAAAKVRQEHGYVNAVIANAGVSGYFNENLIAAGTGKAAFPSVEEYQKDFLANGMQNMTKTLHMNTTGAFYTAITFLDLLDAGNKQKNVPTQSQIIVTCSVASIMRQHPSPEYVASKAAVSQLVKVLSTHFANYGIRVNDISPGWVRSEMADDVLEQAFGKDSDRDGAVPTAVIPAGRTANEEDMAGVALFLLSRAGRNINGLKLVTDGGNMGIIPGSY